MDYSSISSIFYFSNIYGGVFMMETVAGFLVLSVLVGGMVWLMAVAIEDNFLED